MKIGDCMQLFIKNIYKKLIIKSFIKKILIANILICIITLSLLALVIISNISDLLIKKELKFNTQILNSVDEYYKLKQRSAMDLLKEMYLQSDTNFPVISFIRNDFDISTYEGIRARLSFNYYLSSGFAFDSDIRSIEIYKKYDNTLTTAFRNKSPIQESLPANKAVSLPSDEKRMGFSISSSKLLNSSLKTEKQYTFSANIMDEWLQKNIGFIMINYDSTAIEKAYLQYKQDIKGYLLILTPEGDVIFDSSGKYYNKKYPYFDVLKSSHTKAMLEETSIINIKESDDNKVIIAGIITENELFSEIKKIKQTIYLVSVLCFIFTVLLTTLGTSLFSKRIRIIKDAMKKLRKGDLTTRILVSSEDDELSEIASSFNRMGSDLEDYINKVYIANIKQKNAELNALQAQINPHFLYNTLESIRMRAVLDGNSDVGEMIYLLATYFRSTIKQEMIIDIKDEIKYCNIYLELFNIRYEGKLKVTMVIDDSIYEYGILKHILQPLIENYVIHGFDSDKENNAISIKGYLKEADIYIEIEDNGLGISDERLKFIKSCLNTQVKLSDSIGLTNVNGRIKIIYGDNYGLDIYSSEGVGTKILIKIGSKTKKELMTYEQGINS